MVRCHRMGRECVQAVPKPRKRRTESGVGLELANDLPPSISLSGETEPVLVPKGAPKAAPKKQYGFESGTAINSMLSRADIRHTGSKSFTTLLAQGLKLDSAHIVRSFMLIRSKVLIDSGVLEPRRPTPRYRLQFGSIKLYDIPSIFGLFSIRQH